MRRSLVLLKNGKSANQPLLPLKKDVQKVLVAGTHADNLGYQCGGWTVEWQGVQVSDLIVGILQILMPQTLKFKHILNILDGFPLFLICLAFQNKVI